MLTAIHTLEQRWLLIKNAYGLSDTDNPDWDDEYEDWSDKDFEYFKANGNTSKYTFYHLTLLHCIDFVCEDEKHC